MPTPVRYADLHLHTFHSDGTRSPREVIDLARSHGIEIVGISDHDNLAAFFEIKGYADSTGVTLVPATELSAEHRGVDVHILAYAFDPVDEHMNQRLTSFRRTRLTRGFAILDKLLAAGFPLRRERVQELCAGASMGRPHIARALVEAGHVASLNEAFDKLLGPGCPAYVGKERFSVREAVAMVKRAGGLTSVAHPSLYPDHRKLVPEVISLGVDGIECYHPDVDEKSREFYLDLAAATGAMVTGGSDDHGLAKDEETIGTVKVPESLVQRILQRL
ncbi:MAG: PHP domain-containing protein [Acidobacteriota bacterium]